MVFKLASMFLRHARRKCISGKWGNRVRGRNTVTSLTLHCHTKVLPEVWDGVGVGVVRKSPAHTLRKVAIILKVMGVLEDLHA